MRRYTALFASLVFLVFCATAHSQEIASRFQKQHLMKTQQMLIQGLEPGNAEVQITTTQTIRDMEVEFPDEPFTDLVDPLIKLVKNESINVTARLLGLIALDGLHADSGDMAISEVMRYTENKSVKDLCTALRAKSLR